MFDIANLLVAALALAFTVIFSTLSYRQGKAGKEPTYRSEGNEWVEDRNYSYERLLQELVGLDYASTPGLNESSEGTIKQWAKIFEKSRSTWRLVVDDRAMIVAYWSFFFVKPSILEGLKSGNFYEHSLKLTDVMSPTAGMSGPIFISMIATHPCLNGNKEISRCLYAPMMEVIDGLAEQNIEITDIYANTFTPQGRNLAKSLGFNVVGQNIGSPVLVGVWNQGLRAALTKRIARVNAL